MKTSVAMCTYNGARFLREQLESIAEQTCPPDEMVICDDCSADETVEIIKAFIAKAPFHVRLYVNEKNLGSTKNFEQAITLCEGDIIALSDQDDVWHSKKLRRLKTAFIEDEEVGLVFTDAEVVDENLHSLGSSLWHLILKPSELRLVGEGKIFELLLDKCVVTGATLAFRSKFKKRILPFPNNSFWIHDGWIALMVAAISKVCAIEEPLVKYRQHSSQQVGVPHKSSASEFENPSSRAEGLQRQADSRLRDASVLSRVLSGMETNGNKRNHEQVTRARIDNLKEAALHSQARARANTPEHRMRRVPLVAKELLTFRYHRYGNGLLSAAKDILSK